MVPAGPLHSTERGRQCRQLSQSMHRGVQREKEIKALAAAERPASRLQCASKSDGPGGGSGAAYNPTTGEFVRGFTRTGCSTGFGGK
jgi:hypothetical protein